MVQNGDDQSALLVRKVHIPTEQSESYESPDPFGTSQFHSKLFHFVFIIISSKKVVTKHKNNFKNRRKRNLKRSREHKTGESVSWNKKKFVAKYFVLN